ncbi:MAG: bifunctional nuclease family protein [Pirellulales bacterium]
MKNCEVSACAYEAVGAIIDMRAAREARWFCDVHYRALVQKYWNSSNGQSGVDAATEVPFEIDFWAYRIGTDPQELYLREFAGTRRVRIQPSYCEAWAIAWLIQDIKSPRPLTHPAFVATISTLGARLQDVVIHDVVNDLIHARLRIASSAGTVHVDVRASDGIALALAAGVPILIVESLIPEWHPTDRTFGWGARRRFF